MVRRSSVFNESMDGEQVHILHVNSESSAETYSGNKPEDFVCKLPQTIVLEPTGEWYACLRQCSFGFPFTQSPLYVCCDVCSDVITGERKLPALRVVHSKTGSFYDSCLYVPIKATYLDRLRFYVLRTADFKKPRSGRTTSEKPVKPTHFTLELKRLSKESR